MQTIFFVMGAAFSCDYLVTYDTDLQRLNVGDSMKVVSPERFLEIVDCRTYKKPTQSA